MPAPFKQLLIAVLTATLACGPLFAYQAEVQRSRPLFATVTQADAASLDGAAAAVGSTVWLGEKRLPPAEVSPRRVLTGMATPLLSLFLWHVEDLHVSASQ